MGRRTFEGVQLERTAAVLGPISWLQGCRRLLERVELVRGLRWWSTVAPMRRTAAVA